MENTAEKVPHWLDGETQRQSWVSNPIISAGRHQALHCNPVNMQQTRLANTGSSSWSHTRSCGHTWTPRARSIMQCQQTHTHPHTHAVTTHSDPINIFLQPPRRSSNTPDTSDEKINCLRVEHTYFWEMEAPVLHPIKLHFSLSDQPLRQAGSKPSRRFGNYREAFL